MRASLYHRLVKNSIAQLGRSGMRILYQPKEKVISLCRISRKGGFFCAPPICAGSFLKSMRLFKSIYDINHTGG